MYMVLDTHDELMAGTWQAMQSLSSPNSWQSTRRSHLKTAKAGELFRCYVKLWERSSVQEWQLQANTGDLRHE